MNQGALIAATGEDAMPASEYRAVQDELLREVVSPPCRRSVTKAPWQVADRRLVAATVTI